MIDKSERDSNLTRCQMAGVVREKSLAILLSGQNQRVVVNRGQTMGHYGSCVEVWAPGNMIYSTWGPNAGYNSSDPSTWQSQSVTYDNYVYLSGTSMAAPHIAAVAAYLAETQNLGTPGDIETAVRSLFYGTGQTDDAGLPVNLVRLP